MKSVTTHEAKSKLSRLLAEVENGEEVIIRRGQTPVAKLSAVRGKGRPQRPRVGTVTSGPVRYATDAFAPLAPVKLKEWGL